MIDIGKQTIRIKYLQCGGDMMVTLKQVADEESVICSCGQKIQLRDKEGQGRRAINEINNGFQSLSDSFKRKRR